MPSLWFVMPAHGRAQLAAICMRQLRRTCDQLTAAGVDASAVVVACDENLDTAADLGFATVDRDNRFLSRRFNDGIQLACDPAVNPRPADFAVPIGSDDWVDWRLFLELPRPDTIVGFQRISFVREDGAEMTCRQLKYEGGCGIRIIPATLLQPLGFRPADEDRERACDTSILTNLRRHHGDRLRVWHQPSDARQIVDWKSPSQQLNSYAALEMHRGQRMGDPFVELADWFPAEALQEMRAHYTSVLVAA